VHLVLVLLLVLDLFLRASSRNFAPSFICSSDNHTHTSPRGFRRVSVFCIHLSWVWDEDDPLEQQGTSWQWCVIEDEDEEEDEDD